MRKIRFFLRKKSRNFKTFDEKSTESRVIQMRKKWKEKYSDYLVYGGITKQEYQQIEKEVLENDRNSLRTTSMCVFIMFLVLYLASLFSDMMAPNRIAYAATGFGFLVIYGINQMIGKKGKRFVIPLWYVTMTIIFAYAILLNTVIRKDTSSTTFCVIMIAAPLLVTDKPWRLFLYFGMITGIFVFVCFQQKTFSLAYADAVNALCCTFIGSAIHIRVIITKMREMIQRHQIEKERDTDKLSGCLTKAAFERKAAETLSVPGQCGILLVLDLDHFKSVNDNYGHVFGDLVLSTMGECIRQSFPEAELSGRFGGDEFQVWLPGKWDRKELELHLKEFLSRIHAIQTPDGRVKLGASIGVAVCPENGKQYQDLFENADAALYAAKNMGRNRYVFCPGVRMKSGA